jgi:hypothetical protein
MKSTGKVATLQTSLGDPLPFISCQARFSEIGTGGHISHPNLILCYYFVTRLNQSCVGAECRVGTPLSTVCCYLQQQMYEAGPDYPQKHKTEMFSFCFFSILCTEFCDPTQDTGQAQANVICESGIEFTVYLIYLLCRES